MHDPDRHLVLSIDGEAINIEPAVSFARNPNLSLPAVIRFLG